MLNDVGRLVLPTLWSIDTGKTSLTS